MLPWRTSCPLSQVAVKPVPTGGLRPAEPVGKKVRKSQHIFGKGQNGVSINGVTANFMLFDRGTFWSLPFTYYLPKSARAYLFPQSVKFITFAAAPLVLTVFVRNQMDHWLPDGVRTNGAFTEGQKRNTFLQLFVFNARILPQLPCILPEVPYVLPQSVSSR